MNARIHIDRGHPGSSFGFDGSITACKCIDDARRIGRYGALLLDPWVVFGLVRECTPPVF